MGWFSKKSTTPTAEALELEALRAQVAELTARIEAVDKERAKVTQHLTLVDQMLAAKADPTPAEGVAQPALADDVDERFTALSARLDGVDQGNHETAYKLATLDDRVSSIGTELTNQLTELGRDIDALADLPSMQPGAPTTGATTGVSTEHVERLTAGQTNLAKEQARYEISFREELAALAEQVRKNTPR